MNLSLMSLHSKLEYRYSRWFRESDRDRNTFIRIQRSLSLILSDFDRDYLQFQKIKHRRHCSMKRYKDYLHKMMDSYESLVWLTLTFRNPIPPDHRKLVYNFLKERCLDFLCNEDFGELNNRVHYHAICAVKDGSKLSDWSFGFFHFRNICFSDCFVVRISKYANKLANHATKDTCKSSWFHPRGKKVVEKLNFFEKSLDK